MADHQTAPGYSCPAARAALSECAFSGRPDSRVKVSTAIRLERLVRIGALKVPRFVSALIPAGVDPLRSCFTNPQLSGFKQLERNPRAAKQQKTQRAYMIP